MRQNIKQTNIQIFRNNGHVHYRNTKGSEQVLNVVAVVSRLSVTITKVHLYCTQIAKGVILRCVLYMAVKQFSGYRK
jgi:hypothetical protein